LQERGDEQEAGQHLGRDVLGQAGEVVVLVPGLHAAGRPLAASRTVVGLLVAVSALRRLLRGHAVAGRAG